MLKPDLIARVAAQNPHLHERSVDAVVNAILTRISDALVNDDRVELRGLGAFSVKTRGLREGRNPKTGGAVLVAERMTVAFKPGKGMKARLNPPEGSADFELKPTISGLSRHV